MRATWAAAVALAVLAVVLGGVLLLRGDGEVDRADDVKDASERFAIALSSYDHRHLDADFRRVRSLATTGFGEEYDQLLGGPRFADALRQSQAVSTARVQSGPFIGFLTDDEARTFTVLEQEVRNRETPDPRTLRTRVELYLVKTVNGWKVDRVQISS